MSPALYPFIYAFFLLAWPWADADTAPAWQTIAKIVIDYGVFILVAHRTSSSTLSFWAGLTRVSIGLRTGCANITIAILLPVFCWLYLMAIIFTIIGFFVGKAWTEEMWANTTAGIGFGDADSYYRVETVHEADPPSLDAQPNQQVARNRPSPDFLHNLRTVGMDGANPTDPDD